MDQKLLRKLKRKLRQGKSASLTRAAWWLGLCTAFFLELFVEQAFAKMWVAAVLDLLLLGLVFVLQTPYVFHQSAELDTDVLEFLEKIETNDLDTIRFDASHFKAVLTQHVKRKS